MTASVQEEQALQKLQQEYNDLEMLLDGYNKSLTSKECFQQELETENRTLKTYLKAKEQAFSEQMALYEKCKIVIDGYKQNEDVLDKHMDAVYCISEKIQKKYESLKEHATEEINRANSELSTMHADYTKKITKQIALMKGIEVKYNSLIKALDDKTEQCRQMENLISELTQ